MTTISQGVEYFPKTEVELNAYNNLWAAANPKNLPEIAGLQAVEFFKRSKLDMLTLKNIWAQCTPTNSMNIVQFYSALRYITMAQNGIPNLTSENLRNCADWNLGEPKFMGLDLPGLDTTFDGIDMQAAAKIGSYQSTPTSSDVEVKRIIWVELDADPGISKPNNDFARRLLDEKNALSKALREEELKAMSEITNVETITSEIQMMESLLLRYRTQLDSISGSPNNLLSESDRRRLQAQIGDTKSQLLHIAAMRESALRRAEEAAKVDQSNLEMQTLEDRLKRLRYNLEEAKLQQVESHEMLLNRFAERDALRKQVEDAKRSLDKVEEFNKRKRSSDADELEKRRMLEEINELRRKLVNGDSVFLDSTHELETLKEILAGLQADVLAKQKKSQALNLTFGMEHAAEEKAALLRRISEARAQLATDVQAVNIRVTNLEDLAALRQREYSYGSHATNAELNTLRNVLLGLESERDSISIELIRLNKEYAAAEAALTAEKQALQKMQGQHVSAERNEVTEEEKNRLAIQISLLSQQMNDDSRLIREIADKFSNIELERVQIAEMMANLDAAFDSANSDNQSLLDEIELLRENVERLQEEKKALDDEKQRFERQATQGLEDLNGSISQYQTKEQELFNMQQNQAKLFNNKEKLLDDIQQADADIAAISDEMTKLAMKAKDLELQRADASRKIANLNALNNGNGPSESELAAEIDSLQDNLAAAEHEKVALQSELEKMQQQVTSEQMAYKSIYKELSDTQREVDAKVKVLADLTKKRDAARNRLQASNTAADALNQDIATAKSQLDELVAERDAAVDNMQVAGQQQDELDVQIEGLTAEAAAMDSENSATYDELKSLQGVLDGLLEEIEKLSKSLDEANDKKYGVSDDIEAAEKILAEKQQEILRLREEAKALNDARDLISAEINDNRQSVARFQDDIHKASLDVASLADDLSKIDHDIRQINETCFILNENNTECRTELESLGEIASSLLAEVDDYEKEWASIAGEKDKVDANIAAHRTKLAQLEGELKSLRDDEQKLLQAKELLVAQIGSAREKVKEASHITDEHNDKLLGAEDEKSKMEHALNNADANIFILQSANKELDSEVNHMQSILQSLQDEKFAIEEELSRLANRHSDSHATIADLKKELKGKQAEYKAVEAEGNVLNANKDSVAASIADMRAAVASITQEALHANTELNNVDDIKADYENKLHTLKEKKFEKEHENHETGAEIESMKHIVAALEHELKDLQDELGRIAKDRGDSDLALSAERQRIKDLETEIANLTSQTEEIGAERADIVAQIAALRDQVADLNAKVLAENNIFVDLRANTEAFAHKSTAADVDVAAARLELERQRDEIEKLREALASLNKEHETAIKALDGAREAAHKQKQLHAQKTQELQVAKERVLEEQQATAQELLAEKGRIEAQHGALQDALEVFSAEIDDHNQDAANTQAATEALANQCHELDSAITAAKADIDEHTNALDSLKCQLVEVESKRDELTAALDAAQQAAEQRRQEEKNERDRMAEKEKELAAKKELAEALFQERRAVEAQIRFAQQQAKAVADAKKKFDAQQLEDELERMRNLEAVAAKAKADFERLELERKLAEDLQARQASKSTIPVRRAAPMTVIQQPTFQQASGAPPQAAESDFIPATSSGPVSGFVSAEEPIALAPVLRHKGSFDYEPNLVKELERERAEAAELERKRLAEARALIALANAQRSSPDKDGAKINDDSRHPNDNSSRLQAQIAAQREAAAREHDRLEADQRAKREVEAHAYRLAAHNGKGNFPILNVDSQANFIDDDKKPLGSATPSVIKASSPQDSCTSQPSRDVIDSNSTDSVDVYPVVAPSVIVPSSSSTNTPEKSVSSLSPPRNSSNSKPVSGNDSRKPRKSDVMPGFDLISELLSSDDTSI